MGSGIVSIGKGGVGKTTTCVNLAVYYARKGFKTGLLDLDPLSDIATLLDLSESEKILEKERDVKSFSDIKLAVLPNLDLIFPESKVGRSRESAYVVFKNFSSEIAANYDKIILDLPAGSLYEENLIFMQHTDNAVIVTNDEPASHIASGHYIKQVHESGVNPEFLIWHNKYAGVTVAGFDPGDLPGNYNRNVAEEDQFDFSTVTMKDAAFIPDDPAMDLLQSNPSLSVNILSQMSERLDFLIEQRIDEIAFSDSLPGKTGMLIRHYLHLNPFIRDAETCYRKITEYIYILMNTRILTEAGPGYHKAVARGGVETFTEEEKKTVTKLLERIKNDSFMEELLKTSAQLRIALDTQDNSGRMFFSGTNSAGLKAVDRRVSSLLQTLHDERNTHSSYIKSTAGLLLFDFSLYKLFSSKTVINLITDFIPVRKNSRGDMIRDKHKQIFQLIKEEKSYKSAYIKLINTLFPVILKQMVTVVETFNIPGLLFSNPGGIQKDVYLKLMSAFLHNSVNSGLGIIVGFPFRPASASFEKAAESISGSLD